MKSLLLIVSFLTVGLAQSATFRLNEPMTVKGYDDYRLYRAVKLPRGTIIKVNRDDQIDGSEVGTKKGWFRVIRIKNIRQIHSEEKRVRARRINNSNYDRFYVSKAIRSLGTRVDRERKDTPNHDYRNSHRPVRRDRFDSYNSCYTEPYGRWQARTRKMRKNAKRNTAVGIGVGIFGAILSGSKNRTTSGIGSVLAVGGATLAGYGLMSWDNANHLMPFDQCREYYNVDHRISYVQVRGRRCSTRRYYSHGWNSQVEYYQTTCRGQVYYSFERNYDIWTY